MAKLTINIGQTANDKSGDPLRIAFNKINQNFTELYSFNEHIKLKVYSDSAARDTDNPLPTTGVMVMVGTNVQIYVNGVWKTLSYTV